MNVRHIRSSDSEKKKKVAAYCRVSTDKAEQEESIETQVATFERTIRANPNWEYAGIYVDEGKSGTGTAHRPAFQRMIEDALNGRIDIILVKSISRFSRNIIDCRTYVEKLLEKNVSVRFERENIDSQNPACTMMFSLLAAIAQDESRSVPNEDAWIVRMIFQLFVEGKTISEVAEQVTAAGGHGLRCKGPLSYQTVLFVLRNEIYVGDRRLQKRLPVHYLTKKPDPRAEYKSYYLKDDHTPIIDRETWENAQTLLARRQERIEQNVFPRDGVHFLYGKIFCGNCGAPYKRRTMTNRHKSGDERYYKAWNCKERQKGKNGNHCQNPTIQETKLLEQISQKLGWEWNGPEHFDAERFQREVARVEVMSDGNIAVQRIEQAA